MLMKNLQEKIGQMLLVGFSGTSLTPNHEMAQALMAGAVGGVILFDIDYQTKIPGKNILNPAQVKLLNYQLQHYAGSSNPLFIAVDYEGGAVNRLSSRYGFPEIVGAEALVSEGLERAREQARLMAKTLKNVGFNVDFAPVLDVNINPENPILGRLGRCYSEDPAIVAEYAEVFVEECHEQGVLCAYKHFPGHGSSMQDSHLGFVDVTESWRLEELVPYHKLLKNTHFNDFVMTAHIINRQLDTSGLPATLSKPILTDLLRHELNFSGIIITDDMQMQAISDHYSLVDAATLAINAGADMLIYGNQLAKTPVDPRDLVSMIANQVTSGAIDMERIDSAYERILACKKRITS